MKTYVKPIIDVVELSVRENIAELPTAIKGGIETSYTYNDKDIPITVYNLAAVPTSDKA